MNKEYEYSTSEKANIAYNNFLNICNIARYIGYVFDYDIIQKENKVIVSIKKRLNLN